MEEKIVVLKKVEGSMPMIKKIKIGDPMYFEDGQGLKHTYTKSFRGKSDWCCSLEFMVNNIYCEPEELEEPLEFKELCFKVYLAYDERMLELIKQNKLYTRQRIKTTELGVDTASYTLEVNGSDALIKMDGDGGIGYVCEYFTKTKLEAVVIESTIPYYRDSDFELNKKLLESLFNCKLQDVDI